MNEGIEHRLRQLRPGALPESLARQLDQPPSHRQRQSARPALRFGFGVAAALVALAAWHQTQPGKPPTHAAILPPRSDGPAATRPKAASPINGSPGNGPPTFAAAHTTEVTGVRPVSIVTDESNRPWRMMEVNWIEEDTYVFSRHPAVVRTQDQYRTVVPVALTLD